MKLIHILFFLLFVGCNTRDSNGKAKKINKIDSLKNTLVGQWGGFGEDSPIWDIKIDSIYYYQKKKTYRYQIVDKDLVIELAPSKGILKNIFVVKDTIIFNDEQGGTIRGYRFKPKK